MTVYGPQGVAEVLRARLEADMPARLAELAALAGPVQLDGDPEVVAPATYLVGPRSRIEAGWPVVQIVPQGLVRVRAEEPAEGAPAYLYHYRERVFVFARHGSGGHEGVSAARFRLVLALRIALTAAPRLSDDVSVAPLSLREDYSDVGVDPRNQSTHAAAWTEVDVVAREHLSRLTGDPVDTIEVGMAPLPPPVAEHPALQ